MRKTGHSPGPWKWRPVYDEKGKALALLLDCADELRGPVTAIREDRAFWAGYPDRHFGKSEDGRLIAAAPAMIEALEAMVRTFSPFPCEDTERCCEEHEACKAAYIALAMAKGEDYIP